MGIAQQLEGVVRQHIQAPGQQPRDPQTGQFTTPGYQPPQPSTPAYDPDSYLQRRDIETLAPRMITESVTPQFNQVYESLAQTNLDNVRRSNPTIFDKYGPEVYAYVAKLPIQQRTVDNLTTVVKLVRADHVDELAGEIASRRVAEMEPALRSNGSPSVPVASEQQQYSLKNADSGFPESRRQIAAEVGLTDAAIDEFCQLTGMTREQWFKGYGNTVITEVSRGGKAQ